MYAQKEKPAESKSRAVANSIAQKQSNVKQGVGFVDNRSQAIAHRELLGMTQRNTGKSLQPIQKKQIDGTIQRQIDVLLGTNTATKKQVYARGDVEDFQGGTDAGDDGWLGVTKYRARYTVKSTDGKYEDDGSVGPLKNNFTEANRGHVLAKRNGGDGQDEENIFAQDGGANNGTYKSFEAEMSSTLGKYDDDDEVEFVCYLEGTNIYQGDVADAAESSASDISSDEMDSD